ncbi:unnamed protein product [Brassica oleracea var. botrytis]
MDRRDSYEDKHLLYSQAARKAHCWGCCRARVWRFLNRLSTLLPRKRPYFSENPLILIYRRAHSCEVLTRMGPISG